MLCDHPSKHLVWTDVGSRGDPMRVRRLRYQCADCGELFGEFVAHAQATPDTPEVDKDTLRAWNERDSAGWRAHWDETQRQRDEQDAAWWTTYSDYLQSDTWRRLRPLIF